MLEDLWTLLLTRAAGDSCPPQKNFQKSKFFTNFELIRNSTDALFQVHLRSDKVVCPFIYLPSEAPSAAPNDLLDVEIHSAFTMH